jgi:hypothetical protein
VTAPITSLEIDAARASVSAHTVHVELARSEPDGTFTPVLQLRLSTAVAGELAALLVATVARTAELREAIGEAEAPTRTDG